MPSKKTQNPLIAFLHAFWLCVFFFLSSRQLFCHPSASEDSASKLGKHFDFDVFALLPRHSQAHHQWHFYHCPQLATHRYLFWWLFNSLPSVTTDTILLSVYNGRTNNERVKTRKPNLYKHKIQLVVAALVGILCI